MGLSANLEAHEGQLNGSLKITFDRKPSQLIIQNDSGTVDLKFRYKESANFATLLPTEQLTTNQMSTRQLYLQSTSSCKYRVWAYN